MTTNRKIGVYQYRVVKIGGGRFRGEYGRFIRKPGGGKDWKGTWMTEVVVTEAFDTHSQAKEALDNHQKNRPPPMTWPEMQERFYWARVKAGHHVFRDRDKSRKGWGDIATVERGMADGWWFATVGQGVWNGPRLDDAKLCAERQVLDHIRECQIQMPIDDGDGA